MSDAWEWSPTHESTILEELSLAIASEGLPYLQRVRQPFDLSEFAHSQPSLSLRQEEVVIYSLIYAEHFAQAQIQMRDFAIRLQREITSSSPAWTVQWAERTKSLEHTLNSTPALAKAQLEQWEKQSIANLKLEMFPK